MKWKCQKCFGIRECHSYITFLMFSQFKFYASLFLIMTNLFMSFLQNSTRSLTPNTSISTADICEQSVNVNLEGFHGFFDTKFGLRKLTNFDWYFPPVSFLNFYFLFLFISRYSKVGESQETLFLLNNTMREWALYWKFHL